MTVGTKTYLGIAVPLFGESEIVQQTAATDLLTLTGAGSQSGDFLVARNSSGTEKFSLTSTGSATFAAGITATTGNITATAGCLVGKDNSTTAPTTATLAAGGLWVYIAGGTARLAFRQNTTVYYINRTGNL